MAKNAPKKDSGLFGSIFDLNGDGRTDAVETALMFMLFDELEQEEKRKAHPRAYDDNITDLDDMDIEGI